MLKAGLVSLVLAYMLSQFYRAFLAVLAPVLQDQVGAGPGDLALSSGLWFIAFALMQLPVGAALDRFGPRRTVAWLMAVGGAGGAVIFAMADAPWHLHLAMTALGIGCSPALMGPYFIFAREYPPASFGMLAGVLVGFGSLGNILGASPLVWVIEAAGWRQTLWGLAAVTLMVAALVLAAVRDPARLGAGHPQGSIGQILRLRALWFIVPLFGVNYAVTAAIRGLWAAPWLEQVHGADATQIGRVTLAMGLAMVAGSFAVGPAARLAGSARRATMLFSAVMIVTLAVMWQAPALPLPAVTALLVVLGFFGSAYPLLMAHGRSFLPPHLVGRGMTFLNMISIGGVGVMQFASRPVYAAAQGAYAPAQAFAMLWLFFLIPLAIGFLLYFLTPEAAAHD
ncbi:MAG: MFS transporter [Paracoccus sp. (in: a-proteobacteria)]|jgi:predicted MFS family arabinose efflux permease|uniref:MFS transporter n=1 Tax=Paracoccus TaxID=265 RepID=UPI00189146D2|nr:MULTISPECIES: MFS transporter [unclassified Paracoccus (in: a-proteobacteria)]MBF5079022.1 MFS transporter [Paracoccus sp. NBH48]MCO6361375.1 MFS transporter [Paracoccus sp. 08]